MDSGHDIDSTVVDLQVGFFPTYFDSVFHSCLLKIKALGTEIYPEAPEYMKALKILSFTVVLSRRAVWGVPEVCISSSLLLGWSDTPEKGLSLPTGMVPELWEPC